MSVRIVETQDEMGRPAKGIIQIAFSESASGAAKPVLVDFLSGKMQHRLRAGADHEFVVKAIGLKRAERTEKDGRSVFICDFTAGLGTDAFLLAQAGFEVLAFERDAIVYELLADGLRRYREYENQLGLQPLTLEFKLADTAIEGSEQRSVFASDLVAKYGRRPHAVVLDPMFEEVSTKSKSKPKKKMAIFREMLQPSSEEELGFMLETALEVAQRRVLVKRPVGALTLAHRVQPVSRREAKTAAYDIYTCREVSS